MRYTKEEIAAILKKIRVGSELTQKQAAEKIGRKQQTLASWETGQSQPDADTLFLLCDLYGVSIDEAFGFASAPAPPPALSPAEVRILDGYRSLNPEGQSKVEEYIDDLVSSEKYIKNNSSALGKKDA